MSVNLGGVDLNPSLILVGENETPQTFHSVRPTLGATNVVQITSAEVGDTLELVASVSGNRQGWFCTFQIVALQALANTATPITLSYYGKTKSVYIMGIETEEWYTYEPPNDNKRYSGRILLQEV